MAALPPPPAPDTPPETLPTPKPLAARAPEPPPGAVRRTLNLSLLEGSLVQVFLNWTTGSVIIGYMLHLGASATEIGLIASVPMLAQLASPFAAYLGGVAGRLKGVTALTTLVGRGLWLLAAFLPGLGIPEARQSTFIVALVLVSSFFQASTATLWTSWLGGVVPEARRGRYFGFRTGAVGVVGMLANLGAGWFLDRVDAPLNFQVVLGVGVVAAVLGALLLLFHYEPPTTYPRPHLRAVFRTPWQDPNFRKLLVFGVYWQASVLIAAPFVFSYFLTELTMSFTQIAV